MAVNNSLYNALKQLEADANSRDALNYLIGTSTRIAKAYLVRNYNKIARLQDYLRANQDEIAVDAIAGLFCKNKDEKSYHLINALGSWSPPVSGEPEALYFLNKVVASAVEQYISEMLRESDPVFSKIYNSVNYALRKRGYVKKDIAGCRYIVRENFSGLDKDIISYDAFEEIPAACFINKSSYLDDIFSWLEGGYAPAIPVNHLVNRLKKIYLEIEPGRNETPEKGMFINEILDAALLKTEKLLETKYFGKGKLNERETEGFRMALRDMRNDMRDGGLNPGIHKYLEKYLPDLKHHPMYDAHHNILEYLLKMMKKSIAEELRDI